MLLSGCLTAPVNRNFPDIPPSLTAPCGELVLTDNKTTKLSEVLDVVTINYSKYYECSLKVDAWIAWHKEQKKIFDSVK
jgi:hypothetical protein